MIRTVITHKQTDVHFLIPEKFIGKKIEITFLVLDELEDRPSPKKMGDFLGLLSNDEYVRLKEYTLQARDEWNRDF